MKGAGSISWVERLGKWWVRLFVDGERVSYGYFTERDEAEDILKAATEARSSDSGGLTLRTWGERWLTARDAHVRGAAKERACWRTHIEPTDLAAMPLTRIQRRHVVAWLEARQRSGRSVQTVRHARRLLVGAMQAAYDAGHTKGNVARDLRVTMREARTRETWAWLTTEELARLFALPRHDPPAGARAAGKGARRPGTITTKQWVVLRVAVYAGLRAGEMWGLRWRDVHLRGPRPRLVVRHSRDEATKSGHIREVPLLAPAREALELWREVAPGVGDSLVWPGEDGACHVDGYDAGWPRVRRLAGIRESVRWHDLRHTCASHLVQGSWGRVWSLQEVREVLGHSSTRVTERYAHLCPGGIHAAAAQTTGLGPAEGKR